MQTTNGIEYEVSNQNKNVVIDFILNNNCRFVFNERDLKIFLQQIEQAKEQAND